MNHTPFRIIPTYACSVLNERTCRSLLEFATKRDRTSKPCSVDCTTVTNDSLLKSLLSISMLLISFSSQLSDDCLSLDVVRIVSIANIWRFAFFFFCCHRSLRIPVVLFSAMGLTVCTTTFPKGLSSRSMFMLVWPRIFRLDPYNRRTEEIADKTKCTFISSIVVMKTVYGIKPITSQLVAMYECGDILSETDATSMAMVRGTTG